MQLPFFVYGTLRAGQSNARLLRGAIARTRLAKLSGAQMFDMGPYPMIVEGENEIWGELIDIEPDKYEVILKALDRLESVNGADPENPDALYRRLRYTVLAEAEIVESWAYFGREILARRGKLIAGGDWLRRFSWEALL